MNVKPDPEDYSDIGIYYKHLSEHYEELIGMAENCLVCAAIGDPMEVVQNTLEILKEAYDD